MNKYSIPLIPNGVSWWIVNVSDRSIITFIMGSGANGLYAISNKFPTILSSLTGIFNLSWSESTALHIDSPDRDSFFSDIANTVIKLFTALGVGMIACLPFVFPLMINTKYRDAYLYIPPLIIGTMFNVSLCLYNQIYLAKKLSKQVATTTIIGAIVNIIINVLLIRHIGLYAAAVSTAISYAVMALYRHFDLKKYISIKYESGLFIKTFIMFTLAIVSYYYNHIISNIITLIIVCLYAFLLNRSFIFDSLNTIKNKIKHNK